MSLSFPGEFPGKDRKDFEVGPVASPEGMPKEVHGIWYGSPSASDKPAPDQPNGPEIVPIGDDHYPLSTTTSDELRWLQDQADKGGDYAASRVIDAERYRRSELLRQELEGGR